MLYLQGAPQPAQPVPFSDWMSRVRRIANHEPRSPLTDADWQSSIWDAFYQCGMSPVEALTDYLED